MIKVLLVDDSMLLRTITKRMITNEGSDIQVLFEAKNGVEAMNLLKENKKDIDVVILDIEMPKMTGLEVLKEMKELRINKPVIMFSSLTQSGSAATIESLELGAFDFLEKVSSTAIFGEKKQELIQKIKEASKARNRVTLKEIKHRPVQKLEVIKPAGRIVNNLVMIGCSTGGPKSLQEIIPYIPKHIDSSFIVVQHMPVGDYIKNLAKALDKRSEIDVMEAEDGIRIENGKCYIAPGGKQISLTRSGHIVLKDGPTESGHAPSVDYMFREIFNNKSRMELIPVVLTGMGGDGSKSAKLLSDNGISTIVESVNTATVFGMPKQVIEIGAKCEVVDLEKVAEKIIKRIGG